MNDPTSPDPRPASLPQSMAAYAEPFNMTPQGICDSCARIVVPARRGLQVDLTGDDPIDRLYEAMRRVRLCRTCGQLL